MADHSEDQLRKKLLDALDVAGNTHDIDDVIFAVRTGKMQAFSSENAFVVTEVCTAPKKKYINVFLAVGDLAEVMALQPEIVDFARDNGCEFMVMSGRRGWSRVLPGFGWKPAGVTYALPLRG